MKRIVKKSIILLLVITMLISILGTISKLFFGKNLNIATVNEEKNLAIWPSNSYYTCDDLGNGVEKIHFHGDTTNYGWCMDKGANLYGYGYTGGYGHVVGEADAYTTNNAKSGAGGSIQWLLDNMLRLGDSVTDDENGWYRNNLQRILGNSAQISNYSNDQIFKMEQFVLWHFTNNVTGDTGISYPTSDPLYNALYNAAKAHSNYTTKTNNVSIDKTNAVVNSNSVVGPFVVSNNNVMNLTAKLNGTDTKIYTDAECTQELSKYNDYNGNIYIKVTDQSNVNIVFNISSFNTKAKYYTTAGNPGPYRDQSFLMIEREKHTDSVSFEGEKPEKINVIIKKVDENGNPLTGAKFKMMNSTDKVDTSITAEMIKNNGADMWTSGMEIFNGQYFTPIEMQFEIKKGETQYYYILETEAPEGYETYNNVIIISATNKNGNVSYTLVQPKDDFVSQDKDNDFVIILKNEQKGSYSLNVMKKDSNSTSYGDVTSDAMAGANLDVELYKNIQANIGAFNFGAKFNSSSVMQSFGSFDSVAGKTSGPFTRTDIDKNCIEYTLEDGSKAISYDIWKIKENKQPDGYSAMKHQLVLGVEKQYDTQNKTYNIKGIRVFQVSGNNQDGNGINWTPRKLTYKDANGKEQTTDTCTQYATYLYTDDDGCQWNIVLNSAHNNIIVTARNDKRYGSFDLNLTKIIKDTQTPLEGAGFKVSIINTKTNTPVTTKSGKKIDGNAEYKTNNEGKIDEIKDINIESTDTLKVTITESTVPDGYYGLAGPITFDVTPVLSTDGKEYSLKENTPQITNAKKVEVKKGEILVEAENRAVTIHKGVKEVENQDSGYYNEITGDTYESAEDAKSVLHDWVINVPLDEGALTSKIFQVEDTIDERLTYEGVASVKIKDKLDLVENTDYKVDYNEEKRLLTIIFKNESMDFSENIKNNTDGVIEIRFNTKFATDENGKIIGINQSIPNQATLVYGNNNRLDSETPEIHTGGVGIYKYDSTTKKALVGAHFKIATSEENAKNKKFLKDTNGKDIEAITDENGKAEFTGLEFGEDAIDNAKYKTKDETTGAEVYKYNWEEVETTYYIVETEAPAGYNLIKEPREVIVKKDNYNMEDITSLLQVDNEQKDFDLALRKWVTQAIVTENGKTVVTETGHKAEDDPEEVVKVDLRKSKINDVTVKFRYSIRVTNEGEVAGEAKEIRDDVPKGLKFVQEDNPDWKIEDGKLITEKLAGTTLQPGESAEVEILLTWENSIDNMGTMINTAEIQKDHNDYGIPDRDSTPGNNVPGEDDIDDAPVMLTVKTGSTDIAIYSSIALGALIIVSLGGMLIKKKVVKGIEE